ncbi:MAG: HAD-IA family hydrolase [Spongiibacteraceae bacterium]
MLFIFDWDGTLLDSAARIVAVMQQAGDDCGLPSLTQASIKNIIGLGLPEALRALHPEAPDDQLLALQAAYSRRFVESEDVPCSLFPGVLTTLEKLRADGNRLAVATGKSRRGLVRVLAGLGLSDYFDATRCADETRSKPHPQMLHELLVELAVPAECAVMVGDTEYDMEMAVSAGMRRVAVDYGAHAVERLLRYEPGLVLSDFPQLLSWRW